jgi:hypothetical protein
MVSFVDGGNNFKKAVALGFLQFASATSNVGVGEKLSPGETVDWYQIRTKGKPSSSGVLNIGGTAPINQSIEVFFRPTGKKKGLGRKIATFTGGSTDIKKIKALPGTYFLKIALARGASVPSDLVDTFVVNMTSTNVGAFSKATNMTSARSEQGKDLFR